MSGSTDGEKLLFQSYDELLSASRFKSPVPAQHCVAPENDLDPRSRFRQNEIWERDQAENQQVCSLPLAVFILETAKTSR